MNFSNLRGKCNCFNIILYNKCFNLRIIGILNRVPTYCSGSPTFA